MTFDRHTRSAGPSTPTTLSSVAHGAPVPRAARSRLPLIVNLSAVVVGSTIGGTLALRAEPASAPVAPATPAAEARAGATASPPAAPAAPAAPAMPPAAPPAAMPPAAATVEPPAGAPPRPADLHAALVAQITDVLQRFVAWSHAHPRGRCPDLAALGAAELDPWRHALRITCTDQPADQIAGIVSLGPDGVPGTRDDVASWALGAEVTEIVRGRRWGATVQPARAADHPRGTAPPTRAGPATAPATSTAPVAPPPPAPVKPPARTPAGPGAGSNDTDGDGIPDRR